MATTGANASFSDDWDDEATQVDHWAPVVPASEAAELSPGRWGGWAAKQIVRELREGLNTITATETPAFRA